MMRNSHQYHGIDDCFCNDVKTVKQIIGVTEKHGVTSIRLLA